MNIAQIRTILNKIDPDNYFFLVDTMNALYKKKITAEEARIVASLFKKPQCKNRYLITYYTHHSFGYMKSHCTSGNPFISKRIKLRLDCPYVYKCEIKDLKTNKIIYSGNSFEEIAKLGEK